MMVHPALTRAFLDVRFSNTVRRARQEWHGAVTHWSRGYVATFYPEPGRCYMVCGDSDGDLAESLAEVFITARFLESSKRAGRRNAWGQPRYEKRHPSDDKDAGAERCPE